MNIVVKSALAGAALIALHACATPVEITDALRVDPSAFGDGGVPLAGAGGAGSAGAGSGGTGAGTGGSGVATGGTGGVVAGTGGASAGSGMQAAAGASPIGTGGTGLGGAAAVAGAGGVAGGAAGTPATAGTGGGAGAFDATCDFDDPTGCEDLECLAACPANDGGSCSTRCQTLITCVTTDPECTITEADPLCAARVNGAATACTVEADSAGGANTTQATSPAFVARQFVECICSVRP